MAQCDKTCTCPLGFSCLGRRFPEWAEIMRAHWDSGDPVRQQHVIQRSQYDYTRLPEPEIPVPVLSYLQQDSPQETNPPQPPGLATMARSLAGTMVQEVKHVITGHAPLVSEDVFQTRVAICKGDQGEWGRCRFLQELPRLRCLKCGCDGEVAFRLPVKSCPIGRWPART